MIKDILLKYLLCLVLKLKKNLLNNIQNLRITATEADGDVLTADLQVDTSSNSVTFNKMDTSSKYLGIILLYLALFLKHLKMYSLLMIEYLWKKSLNSLSNSLENCF